MATTKGMTLKKNNQLGGAKQLNFAQLSRTESVVNRFTTIFSGDKKRAEQYLGAALSLVNSEPALLNSNPASIMAGIGQAALLNLPLNKSFGNAYLVPYGGNVQFIVGYKGYLRMMQNSQMYKSIVMETVYEGEITNWNKFTETYDIGERKSDAIVGFFARFELLNGFAKAVYLTKAEVDAHAKKFSKGGFGWKNHYEAMGMKTAFLRLVKYAPMTEELQMALESDNKIIKEMKDNPIDDAIDIVAEDFPVEPIEPVEEEQMGSNFVEDPMEEVPAELFKEN